VYVALADGGGQRLTGIQAGQFGGAHGAPQPSGLVTRLLPAVRRERVHEQLPVSLPTRGGGLGCPGGMQDRQVTGVRQGLLPCRKGGELPAVSLQHVPAVCTRCAARGRPLVSQRTRLR
jgi:hypothetical protein